jgi:hypothetical protein
MLVLDVSVSVLFVTSMSFEVLAEKPMTKKKSEGHWKMHGKKH